MDSYGINLIVKTTLEGALELSEKEVRSLLSSFIVRSVKEFLIPGVFAVAEGYSWRVVIFNSVHPSSAQVMERGSSIW